MQAHHELAVNYIPAAVVKLSAHGKYMDNILQPHNTPLSLHQMKEVLWASQGAINTGKLLALKMVGLGMGIGKHWLSQISLFKVDNTPSSI